MTRLNAAALSVSALVLGLASAATAQDPGQDGMVITGGSVIAAESADAVRVREAIAYANPLPRGAPDGDYPLVAWCDALVSGHAMLGETLTDPDELDRDIIRLGRAEATTFQAALTVARPRQSPAVLEAARVAAAQGGARWIPLMAADEPVRSEAFGLFFGLPGRCEHAARRLQDNITTAPPTPRDVGLE